MKVESSSQVVGWEYNNKITLVKNTYHYDEGNNVTVVEKRIEAYNVLYDSSGKNVDPTQLGNNIDTKA